MTKGELKKKIDDYMVRNIIHLTKDPTLGETVKDQIKGLIFRLITGSDYWFECDDNEQI